MDYELVELIGIPMGIFDPYGNALLGSGWLSVCTDFHCVNLITSQLVLPMPTT